MNLLPIAVLAALGVIATALARRAPRAGRSRRLGALVAVAAIGTVSVGACSGSDGEGSTQVAREPSIDHAPLDWGDGLDHVVVYADPPTPAAAETVPTSTDPQTGPSRSPAGLRSTLRHPTGLGGTGAPQPASDRTLALVALDGSVREVTVPQESLVAVGAATAGEAAALETWGQDGGFALLVADVTGVVGPPGTRYVMTVDRLIELPGEDTASSAGTADEPAPSTSTAADDAPAAADDVWSPPAAGEWTAEAENSLLDAIRAVDGVESAETVAPGVVAVATSGDRDLLAEVEGVREIGDDVLLDYAVDERQGEQWALENTGSGDQAGGWPGVEGADTRTPRAWSISEGSGVVVAVLDSGVDLDHEDLTTRLWTNTDEICANGIDDDANGRVDDCAGWDFGVGDANPRPDALVPAADHGTHVAGIIAAGRNGIGVVGVAPSATVMPLKVSSSTGSISTSAVYAAIVYAVDQGADIVNISLATRPGTSRSSVTALENGIAYAHDAGVLVVVGAGNDGVDITTRSRAVWPAGFSLLFDNVVTVGATTNSDTRASFSNFGDPITLYAPGWWMLSTVPGGYGSKSGTSMAAPMVAGAAADVIASGLATTPADVRGRLVSSAEVLDVGYRLDVAAAVGVPPDADIDVTYEGIDQLLPDTVADLSVRMSARSLPAPATHVRLSLAAAVDYDVFAVEGLAASLAEAGGATATVRSDASGAFPPIAITDPDALAGAGWTLSASLALPEGDYAFVTELLDESGNALGGSQVAYVTVGDGLPVTSTTLGATTIAPSTTAGGSTTSVDTTVPGTGDTGTTVPGTDGSGTTTTDPGGPTTTDPDAPTTTDSGAATTTDPGGPTTTDPDAPTTTDSGAATTIGGTTTVAPSTTAASSTTVGASTTVAPTTTSGAATTIAATSTTAGGPTTTVAGPTTTPIPDSDTDGPYRIDSMSPRYATLDGTTVITISGAFPMTIPVYVWFGDKGIVEAASADGDTLVLTSPEVLTAGVTDVSVRFTLDRAYRVTLQDAFTFGTAPSGATTTTAPGASTTTTPGSPTTSTGSATTVAGPTTTGGGGATTTSTGSATTVAGPTTTAPGGSTTSVSGSTTTSTTIPLTPDLDLRPLPPTGALSTLTTASWPRPGCTVATCAATARPAP